MSTHTRHVINFSNVDGVIVVEFVDDMLTDEGVLGAIGEQLDDLADTTHADMLLDFRGVRYMSSGMLAVLMPLQRKLARSGSALKLCNLDRALQEVFRVTALHRVLPIYGDAQTALDAFGRSRR